MQEKQEATTLVTPPNIPDRRLAKQIQVAGTAGTEATKMYTTVDSNPPTEGRYRGTVRPNMSLQLPMKQSTNKLGTVKQIVDILMRKEASFCTLWSRALARVELSMQMELQLRHREGSKEQEGSALVSSRRLWHVFSYTVGWKTLQSRNIPKKQLSIAGSTVIHFHKEFAFPVKQ